MTRDELKEALRIIYAGEPKDDKPYGCVGAQDAVLAHDAEQREEIAKLRDTRDSLATQLNEYVQEAAQKEEEIVYLQDKYEGAKLLKDSTAKAYEQLQADLDHVLGEAVGFAGIVKSTRVWADDVQQAIQFLNSPLVHAYRARQGRWATYLGASDSQVAFGGNTDPRSYLTVGRRYQVDRVVVHDSVTDVYLKDYPGKGFNSVCFDLDIADDLEAWRARQSET